MGRRRTWVSCHLAITPEQYDQLKGRAGAKGRTFNRLVREVVSWFLRHRTDSEFFEDIEERNRRKPIDPAKKLRPARTSPKAEGPCRPA